jgi:hypothetical protein
LFISFAAGALMLSVHVSAAYAGPVRTTGGLLPWDPDWPVQQNLASRQLKSQGITGAQRAGTLPRSTVRGPNRVDAPPASLTLATGRTGRIVEMPGFGQDDRDKSYVDSNYWNICSAGAATVAASYFIPDPFQMSGAFHEPYGPFSITTRWDEQDVDANLGFDARARAYMLFMAMNVDPPSFDRPGIDDFSTYPTRGGSPQAIRDAINWEISDHAGGGRWITWFYFTEPNTGLGFTADKFNADVVADVWGSGAPVIVAVDADFLPNWPDLTRPLHHAITIVGYDNADNTYTYLDTCGRQCGSTTNGGTHEIAQKKLFKAMQMVGRVGDDGQTILRADGTPRYPNGGYIW